MAAAGATSARRRRLLGPLLRPAPRTHPAPRHRRPRVRDQLDTTDRTRLGPPDAEATNLTRDLATWRAARDIADTDLRPTGPSANDRAGSRQQSRLDRRVAEAGGLQARLEPAAARLAETIHPGITADPQWPTLARQITAAEHADIDRAELRRIATSRPLPIEHPAAALAYRLTDAIGRAPDIGTHVRGPSSPHRARTSQRRCLPAGRPRPHTGLAPTTQPGLRR